MADCLSCLSEDYCKNKDKIEKLEKELDEANKQYKAIQQKYNQLKKQLGG
jgi:molecular chaperone GrpE (heat shock protein)